MLRLLSKSHLLQFYFLTFFLTWIFWIPALIILKMYDFPLYANETIFHVFSQGFHYSAHIAATLLLALGTYGPLAASILLRKYQTKGDRKSAVDTKIVIFVLLFPILLAVAPSVINSGSLQLQYSVLSIIPLFLYQLFTSGFEEFGWRGFALPKLLESQNATDAGWNLGIVWAVWHLPIVVYLYANLPIMLLLLTILGFGMNIIGMSILYSWIFVNTQSVFLAIIFHALTNTFSIFFLGSYDNPALGLVPAALVWGTVFILGKVYGESLKM